MLKPLSGIQLAIFLQQDLESVPACCDCDLKDGELTTYSKLQRLQPHETGVAPQTYERQSRVSRENILFEMHDT
jgi:hypothetical protein